MNKKQIEKIGGFFAGNKSSAPYGLEEMANEGC